MAKIKIAVAGCLETGYMMHDRLLRPAMVGVSKKPQKATEVESDKELKSRP